MRRRGSARGTEREREQWTPCSQIYHHHRAISAQALTGKGTWWLRSPRRPLLTLEAAHPFRYHPFPGGAMATASELSRSGPLSAARVCCLDLDPFFVSV